MPLIQRKTSNWLPRDDSTRRPMCADVSSSCRTDRWASPLLAIPWRRTSNLRPNHLINHIGSSSGGGGASTQVAYGRPVDKQPRGRLLQAAKEISRPDNRRRRCLSRRILGQHTIEMMMQLETTNVKVAPVGCLSLGLISRSCCCCFCCCRPTLRTDELWGQFGSCANLALDHLN